LKLLAIIVVFKSQRAHTNLTDHLNSSGSSLECDKDKEAIPSIMKEIHLSPTIEK